jgi:hypothetical protein
VCSLPTPYSGGDHRSHEKGGAPATFCPCLPRPNSYDLDSHETHAGARARDPPGLRLAGATQPVACRVMTRRLRSNLPRGGYPWQALAAVAEQRRRCRTGQGLATADLQMEICSHCSRCWRPSGGRRGGRLTTVRRLSRGHSADSSERALALSLYLAAHQNLLIDNYS